MKNIFFIGCFCCIGFFLFPCVLFADWVIDGTHEVLESDTYIAGSIIIKNGGRLVINNATLTLELDYDEQYYINVDETSQLIINNGIVRSMDYQYWIELHESIFTPSCLGGR